MKDFILFLPTSDKQSYQPSHVDESMFYIVHLLPRAGRYHRRGALETTLELTAGNGLPTFYPLSRWRTINTTQHQPFTYLASKITSEYECYLEGVNMIAVCEIELHKEYLMFVLIVQRVSQTEAVAYRNPLAWWYQGIKVHYKQ